jgi:hypothetical protein
LFISDEVWRVLEATGFVEKYDSQIYLSVHDAVLAATIEGEGEYGEDAVRINLYNRSLKDSKKCLHLLLQNANFIDKPI